MHGVIGQEERANVKTTLQAFGGSGASSGSQAPASARQVRPDDDPRTRAYVEG